MITFPVKTNKENAAVSPSFGKAKYFAFFDGENITVEANPFGNGAELIGWFLKKGVDKIIIKEMGSNPFNKIKKTGMRVYYAGDGRITTDEIIQNINNNTLSELNQTELEKIVKKHEGSGNHGHNHSHNH